MKHRVIWFDLIYFKLVKRRRVQQRVHLFFLDKQQWITDVWTKTQLVLLVVSKKKKNLERQIHTLKLRTSKESWGMVLNFLRHSPWGSRRPKTSLYIDSQPGWLPTAHSWAPLHRCSRSTWWVMTWFFVFKREKNNKNVTICKPNIMRKSLHVKL